MSRTEGHQRLSERALDLLVPIPDPGSPISFYTVGWDLRGRPVSNLSLEPKQQVTVSIGATID